MKRLSWAVRRLGPPLVGLGAIVGLIFVVSPRALGQAFEHFNVKLVPVIIALWAAVYLLQGLRWHLLLRDAGARLDASDSQLLNMSGQAITAVLPLGDLTRAVLAGQVSGIDFGGVVATITVQELSYTFILILFTAPVAFETHQGAGMLAAVVIFMIVVFAILTVPALFRRVHLTIMRVPLLRRFVSQIDELQLETVYLLHRPKTFSWAVLDVLRAAAAISAFWLVVWGLVPGQLGWGQAAFVFTVAGIGGAISLIPGGAGATEAGWAGLLVLLGVAGGPAGAAALLQRGFQSGTAAIFGLAAYAVARRRLGVRMRLPTPDDNRRWQDVVNASPAAAGANPNG